MRVVVQNVQVVSSVTGAVHSHDIVVRDGWIESLVAPYCGQAPVVVVGDGQYAVPGYIDPHLHIESSFVTPAVFAEAVVARGTTTFAPDAHEVANVLGPQGLKEFMRPLSNLPVTVRWMIPSSVPSVDGRETTGGRLDPSDVRQLLSEAQVGGLGEVMDVYGLVQGDPRVEEILRVARDADVLIEGHAPDVSYDGLEALLRAGVDSDHSKSQIPVLLEKLRLGMFLELQPKTLSPELVHAVRALPLWPPFALCSDDVSADVLFHEGHLDRVGRLAHKVGFTVSEVLRALTWEPSRRLRLWDRGIIAPGRRADILLVPQLAEFTPSLVMCAGEVVAREGSIVDRYRPQTAEFSSRFYHTVRVPPLAVEDFHWMVHDVPDGAVDVPAIAINEQDNYTVARTIRAEVRQKRVFLPSPGALLMMMERYSGEGNRSYAALVGMDFERGAVASTYSHDAHNLTVLGTDACDMWKAAEAVIQAGGGIAVAVQGSIAAVLPLPVAGLMSEASLAHVARKARALRQALAQWGYRHQNPFMNFSTLGLLVSPEIRLSDQGLVNVRTRQWWPCALYRHG